MMDFIFDCQKHSWKKQNRAERNHSTHVLFKVNQIVAIVC